MVVLAFLPFLPQFLEMLLGLLLLEEGGLTFPGKTTGVSLDELATSPVWARGLARPSKAAIRSLTDVVAPVALATFSTASLRTYRLDLFSTSSMLKMNCGGTTSLVRMPSLVVRMNTKPAVTASRMATRISTGR